MSIRERNEKAKAAQAEVFYLHDQLALFWARVGERKLSHRDQMLWEVLTSAKMQAEEKAIQLAQQALQQP
jgi:hypothetical protein